MEVNPIEYVGKNLLIKLTLKILSLKKSFNDTINS